MKVSKYTFLFDIGSQEYYAYNTLSNALLEIDSESFAQLRSAQIEHHPTDRARYDTDLYDALTENKIITEQDDDDLLLYKSIISKGRAQSRAMHLTLAPTMDCCFRCHYCFEKYKEKIYMSSAIMDRIIKYILLQPELQAIKLTWFGGEPLMALSQMEEFYDKLSVVWNKPVVSNIITTGYHLDQESVRVFKKMGIKSIQITLDGMKETHNRVKQTAGCDDVFEKVLKNIELLDTIAPDIHIVIRVNLTLDNAGEYVGLYKLLTTRFKGRKNINPAPAFVLDRGTSNCNKTCSNLFTLRKQSEFILNLVRQYKIDSPYIPYPQRFFNECAIRNNMAVSFAPEGFAYKCWEMIGNKEYAIGRLNEDGAIININQKLLNRQLYGNDPMGDPQCKKCAYLPICNGGCPIQRIENQFEGKHNCTCTYYKGYIEEFLKVHIALKKVGYNNSVD